MPTHTNSQYRTRRQPVVATPPDRFARYALLPLRMFLAVTFFYAGIQKLMDPGYFSPTAPTYIGSQLAAFAGGSPIGFLIQWFALPFPTQIGWAVIIAEIGIGVLTFIGLFSRLAAVVGALLSLSLFLSATWDVQPYFLGSDSIYAVAWITLAIAGDGGVFSLSSLLTGGNETLGSSYLGGEVDRSRRRTLLQLGGAAVAMVWVLGLLPRGQASADNTPPPSPVPSNTPNAAEGSVGSPFLNPTVNPTTSPTGVAATPSPAEAGDDTVAATASSPSATSVPALAHQANFPTSTSRPLSPTAVPPNPTATHTAPLASPTPTGTLIGTFSQLQQRGALTYTDPQSGDPAVVIHLGGNKIVAYSAVCTHAGCTVRYSSAGGQRLVCPCHGAIFDPTNSGQAIRGPARRPLPEFNVTLAANGNIYAT